MHGSTPRAGARAAGVLDASASPPSEDLWLFEFPDGFAIRINRIGDLGFSWFWGEDKDGRFWQLKAIADELPEPRREIAGFPVIGEFLSISLPNKLPRSHADHTGARSALDHRQSEKASRRRRLDSGVGPPPV